MHNMSVPSLYRLVFNKICLRLWKALPLLTLHAEFVHKHKEGYPDEEEEEFIEYQRQLSAMLEYLEKSVERTGLPLGLRKEIMNAVNSIDEDVSRFMSLILVGLVSKTLNNIKVCALHIVYTDNVTINVAESICNILLESKFKVMFKRFFLGDHCVKKRKVRDAYHQVFKKRNPKSLRNRQKLAIKFVNSLITCEMYWARRRRNHPPDYSLDTATDMQFVGVLGSFEAFEYFYELFRKKSGASTNWADYSAKFLVRFGDITTEKIVFFQEKLQPKMWLELLKDNFKDIFVEYLKNWRYRGRCMSLFSQVNDTIDKKTFHSIFREILIILNCNRYDSYGVLAVTRAWWNAIPAAWKIDSETVDMVPYLALPTKNFDILQYFLGDYTVDVQEDIIANTIYRLLATSEEEHIEALIQTTQVSGFKQTEGKQFLTIDRLKNFLIHNGRNVEYDKITKYLCNSTEEEHELKQGLLQDKYFIIDFIVNIYWDDNLCLFLKWALKDKTKANAFKAELLEDGLVDCIYERRLIESDLYHANKIFEAIMCNLNEWEIIALRKRVKENTMVVHWFLRNTMHDSLSTVSQFFDQFFFSKEESEEVMREFLYMPETIQAVYEMVLDMPNFEISMKYSYDGSELMLGWLNFITEVVRPYIDATEYKNRLMADLGSVVSECYEKILLSDPRFGSRDHAERIIKLRFRCFALCWERRGVESALNFNFRYPQPDPEPFMIHFVNTFSSGE